MAVVRSLLSVLPYLSLLVCLLGLAWRLHRWRRAPATPAPLFPLPSTRAAAWRRLAVEICLLRGLRAGDQGQWYGAWPLHVALALLAVGHIRAVVDFPGLWRALGLTPEAVDGLAALAGGGVGLAAMAACLYLLVRRGLVRRLREITRGQDVLALVLLLAVVASGNVMRFGARVDLGQVRAYFAALACLRPVPMPEVPGFALHFLLAQALFVWAPFGKYLHAPGLFLAKAGIARR
jgi:nitrate reductase gamma subunit